MAISQNFPAISPTLNLNFARSKKLDPRITFTRTSSATRTNAQGLIEVVSTDTPRFEHSYNSSTGSVNSLGLLVEESRTNLFLRSQDLLTSPNLTDAGLSSLFTATVDALPSPSGSTNETVKFVSTPTTSQGLFLRQTGLSLTAQTYTVSVYVYVPTQAGITNWAMLWDYADSVDNIQTTTQTTFDRWVRISGTATLTSTRSFLDFNIRINNSTAPTASGFTLYAWGAQLEAGTFPTSYIPTVASTVTRSGDLAFINLPSTGWYNYSQGSLVFQHSTVPWSSTGTSPGYPAVGFAQTDGGATNSIQYFFDKGVGTGYYLVRDTNVDQAGLYLSGSPAAKVGFAYTTNLFVLARNGSQVGTDTSGTVPQSIGTLLLGGNAKNVANNFNACISNVIYYPRALSSSQLQNLTK
jgi:hypothetical protein